MPRISITVRYSLLVLFSILATSGLLLWFVVDLITSEVRAQLIQRGESVTQQLAYVLAPVLLSEDYAKVRAALNKVTEQSDVLAGAVIEGERGLVVATQDEKRIGQPYDDPAVPWKRADCQGMVEDPERDRFVFMHEASFSGTRVGCVIIQLSRAALGRTLETATSRVLFATLLIALVVIALAFLTLRRTLRPLAAVIDGTRRIAEGDFSTRIEPSSRDEIGELAVAFNGMAARTELFFRYLDKSIAERLVENEALAQPGGRLKQVSVLFGDMRGFTELSNERSPGEVVHILNTYFDLFFQIIHHHRGVVDKTMGDSVMAFYEPFRSSDTSNARRAILSAIAMRAVVWGLERSLAEAAAQGVALRLAPCRFGFSVATGRLIVGNIGSQRHMDYTVCGPAVNLAARLQQDTERGEIIMDRFTAMDVEELVAARQLPQVLPKGFVPSQEVTPFLVTGLVEQERAQLLRLLDRLFDRRFFLQHVIAVRVDDRPLPVEQRTAWADRLAARTRAIISDQDSRFLVT